MISTWKQELTKRASELFARGNKAPTAGDAQRVIDDLHRQIGQLQVKRDFLAGQRGIVARRPRIRPSQLGALLGSVL
jgi:transposase